MDQIEEYEHIWSHLLASLTDLDYARREAWIVAHRAWAARSSDMFFHETAAYYAASKLVPADIWRIVPLHLTSRALGRIAAVVDGALRESPEMEKVDWCAVRDRLDAEVSAIRHEFGPATG